MKIHAIYFDIFYLVEVGVEMQFGQNSLSGYSNFFPHVSFFKETITHLNIWKRFGRDMEEQNISLRLVKGSICLAYVKWPLCPDCIPGKCGCMTKTWYMTGKHYPSTRYIPDWHFWWSPNRRCDISGLSYARRELLMLLSPMCCGIWIYWDSYQK